MQKEVKINLSRKEAFDGCFRSHYQSLCFFAYNFLKVEEEAEDVVQEVFIKLLDEKESFESEEHLKNYLYKLVRNACLNRIKLSGIHLDILKHISSDYSGEGEDKVLADVVKAEIYKEILAAVKTLPKENGRIFRLAFVEGLTNDEIASALGISVNTVKVQKNRAKKYMREKLKGLYPCLALFFFFYR